MVRRLALVLMRLPLLLGLTLILVGGTLPAFAVVDFCDPIADPNGCPLDFTACEFDFDYGATGGGRMLPGGVL